MCVVYTVRVAVCAFMFVCETEEKCGENVINETLHFF